MWGDVARPSTLPRQTFLGMAAAQWLILLTSLAVGATGSPPRRPIPPEVGRPAG
jgi:hypothetical protein